MIITTSDNLPQHNIIEVIGIVEGSTVRAKHIGKDILAGFKNLIGGEVKQYTELLNDARKEAMSRMERNAKLVDADAIINVRIVTSMVSQMASEILIYGTAVKIDKK
jgi:uncharacterized protein YbjQ (UPF0145 family)|tara:strand:+ start:444 stop:764 length:321 start_codon:yes stop_codon:yes gene_type:complete